MRVIVTRPAHSSERTARKLTALGYKAFVLPLSEPTHDPDAAITALGQNGGALAVTSAEAIRALAASGAALAPHLKRPLFAVGKRTADAARKIGFAEVFHSEGDGAGLADLIDRQRTLLADLPVTYLAGSPRAQGFEARMAEHGISVSTAEVYHMRDLNPGDADLRHLLLEQKADAILFYSSHTARRFFALPVVQDFQERLHSMRFYCLSEQIAAAIPAALRARAVVAAQPTEESLLGLLGRGGPAQF